MRQGLLLAKADCETLLGARAVEGELPEPKKSSLTRGLPRGWVWLARWRPQVSVVRMGLQVFMLCQTIVTK